MRIVAILLSVGLLLSGCMRQGQSDDPFEPVNRKTFQFNRAFDATVSKPLARLYLVVLPAFMRTGIDNVYNNIAMIPTVGNDILQGEWHHAIRDTWRFSINTTIGVGGIFDWAQTSFALPPHYNDLGMTFAKWGMKRSPYIVLPILGPSTLRDASALAVEYYTMTPYPLLHGDGLVWGVWGLRYVDLRAQLFDQERLMQEALDPYIFVRDAWLQYRDAKITTNTDKVEHGAVEDLASTGTLGHDYVE